MLILRNLRVLVGALFIIYGVFLTLLGLLVGEMILYGLFAIGIGYLLAFHLENSRKKKVIMKIEDFTQEKVLSIIPATYRNEKHKLGDLALTQSSIIFNRQGDNYIFPLDTVTSIGTTSEGTGNFVSTMQQHGYVNTMTSVELKRLMFYMEGEKNGSSYLEYFYCNDVWWANKAMNKFYKNVSRIGEFNSSLDAHKA